VPPTSRPTPIPEPDKPNSNKGRLSEIVESSKHTLDHLQHTLDERIRAIVPGVGLIRELQAEVRRLTQRVDELEARLAKVDGQAPKPE
jgi:polyhydroxyalkanoate synthesis regulator phasin